MDVLDYCWLVLEELLEVDVCPEQGLLYRVDLAKARLAVSRCCCGESDVGLAIAEEIAKRWQLPV